MLVNNILSHININIYIYIYTYNLLQRFSGLACNIQLIKWLCCSRLIIIVNTIIVWSVRYKSHFFYCCFLLLIMIIIKILKCFLVEKKSPFNGRGKNKCNTYATYFHHVSTLKRKSLHSHSVSFYVYIFCYAFSFFRNTYVPDATPLN